MEELKKEIRAEIEKVFRGWDCCEISDICARITDAVADDVIETSDYPSHNSSDIRISIKRVILSCIEKKFILD